MPPVTSVPGLKSTYTRVRKTGATSIVAYFGSGPVVVTEPRAGTNDDRIPAGHHRRFGASLDTS